MLEEIQEIYDYFKDTFSGYTQIRFEVYESSSEHADFKITNIYNDKRINLRFRFSEAKPTQIELDELNSLDLSESNLMMSLFLNLFL